MSDRAASIIGELECLKGDYGREAGFHKMKLLRMLENRRLRRATDVLMLHEILCFLRAYPDNAELLASVERMLAAFAERSDLHRHRRALLNTGIAGTVIRYPFFAVTAGWLAHHWGNHFTIVWEDFERHDRLEQLLSQLALYGETPGLDEFAFEPRDWIDRLKSRNETDATFLVRRFEQLPMSSFMREILLDDLDIPFQLSPGPNTPARTREKYPSARISYQSSPLSQSRPFVSDEVLREPSAIRLVTSREGQVLIDLARSTMATRSRDIDAFAYGDRNDVRLVDCGKGLQFVYIGVLPERRFLLETLYGFLILKNGVPVGYGTNISLFNSSEIAYSVFDTFRAGEAAPMYGRLLSITRHLFKADTFVVDPYQIGQDNDDAIRSGAWWFYQKLGFRPKETRLLRIMKQELNRMKASRTYRSSASRLKKLATGSVFLHLSRPREDVLGVLPLANTGLRITRFLAEQFGYDRRRGTKVCSQEVGHILGVRSIGSFTRGERLAWERWSPLVMILPGIRRWSRQDKRALVAVIRAKGGRRESDYLLRFDQHRHLRKAIRRLTQEE